MHLDADVSRERLDQLLAQAPETQEPEKRARLLAQLLDLHPELGADPDAVRAVRHAFIDGLNRQPSLLGEERFMAFLVEHIEPEDLSRLEWEHPERVIDLCEHLYDIRLDEENASEQVRTHVDHVLRYAAQQFEARGDVERLFQLLQVAPTSALTSPELLRLRGRAHMYEVRRVQKKRRWLYAYLVFQALLVLVAFPLLFINAENGELQEQIEETTEVDLSPEGRQYLTYFDGLYWSIITAASIGYGDITPRTDIGRGIAAVLGTMGVITVGVVAGLILSWLTPRRLD